ncbi:hypothetical protein B0H17DRAFT_1247092 [Mycena rosella]|uniref:Uncharacterized protein n=1 Tax=Mycena rosella TaxID=1033263 RepID=A0AAD7G9L7_MYCRO|nr:hypothetical protein B0H17DRAFT_1247092 [Mycena rosella]
MSHLRDLLPSFLRAVVGLLIAPLEPWLLNILSDNSVIYLVLTDAKPALGDSKLSAHEIDSTVFRAQPNHKGNVYYETSDGTACKLCGQVHCGDQFGCSTWITAKNSPPVPKFKFEVTGWIACVEDERVKNIILLWRLHQTYDVFPSYQLTLPNRYDSAYDPRTPRKKITNVNSAVASSSTEASDTLVQLQMNSDEWIELSGFQSVKPGTSTQQARRQTIGDYIHARYGAARPASSETIGMGNLIPISTARTEHDTHRKHTCPRGGLARNLHNPGLGLTEGWREV